MALIYLKCDENLYLDLCGSGGLPIAKFVVLSNLSLTSADGVIEEKAHHTVQ